MSQTTELIQIQQLNNYHQYAQAAVRTLKNVDLNFDLAHMGLGISSEYFELKKALKNKDYINAAEEIGDAQWYLANHLLIALPQEKQKKLFDQLTLVWFKPQASITTVAEELDRYDDLLEVYTDLTKRHGVYNKQVDNYDDVLMALAVNISRVHVNILINLDKVGTAECLTKNINKLLKRYPDKYDEFLAVNRDLKIERTILEA